MVPGPAHHSPVPQGTDVPTRPGKWAGCGPRLPRSRAPWAWAVGLPLRGPAPAPSKRFHRIFALNATRRKCEQLFFLENSLPPLRPHCRAITRSVSLMELQREIKVSQISVLLHNVPDTPFCKQIFLFFWLKDV